VHASLAPPRARLSRARSPALPRARSLSAAQRIFASHNLEYDVASDGAEAVRMVVDEGRRYDLILMDNQMPNMSGTHATRALRAAGYKGVIVGMTGDPLGCEEREEFDAAGLTMSLEKDSNSVAHVLALLADMSAKAQRAHQEAAAAAPPPPVRAASASDDARAPVTLARTAADSAALRDADALRSEPPRTPRSKSLDMRTGEAGGWRRR
jgi:CheY-like chemotaxis protein